jgi:iron complex outermembrane receptor protein
MRHYLLVTTSVIGLCMFSAYDAHAQSAGGATPVDAVPTNAAPANIAPTDAASADSSAGVETVEVTGTRISRPGYNAPTPLTVLSSDQLTAANPGAPVDALRQLPVLASSTGPRGATGSAGNGGAFLNLRGLGANNTLVLLDGERFVATSGNGTVDVDMFPTALISRTDIVTGGASAAYGSDAVAGVVNFVVDHDFTGFKATAQAGTSTYGDDDEVKFSAAFGSSFGNGHGHILLGGEYYDSKGIYSLIDRPLGQKSCAAITNPGGTTGRVLACDVRSSQGNFAGLINSGPLAGTTFDNSGNPIPFHYGSLVSSTTMVGGDGIKTQFLPEEVPQRRDVFYGRTSWDFNNSVSAYVEVNYGAANYDYQIGSYDQNLGSSTGIVIKNDNAFLPASLRTAMAADNLASFTMSKYFADLPRTWIENNNQTARTVLGVNGVFGDWSWNAHFEHAETWSQVNALYDENMNNVANATDAIVGSGGQIVCRSAATNPSCVPFNPMGNNGITPPANGVGVDGVSDAQLNYLTGTDWQHTRIKEDDAVVNVSGEPFSNWAGPVSIATGAEWRDEGLRQSASPDGLAINNSTGLPGPFRNGNYQAAQGSFSVIEGYIETVTPLLRDLPFAKSVDFNGAARLTNYSNAGAAFTWKAGLSWEVNDDIRIRATRSRDERAPNLTELYSGTVTNHSSVIDYPRGTQFVTPQALIYTAGNPNLKPEVGDTTTAGLVYSPSWFSGWQSSADFYHIVITGAIVSLPGQTEVQQCGLGAASYCSDIVRDGAGNLFAVYNSPQNAQSLSTTGIDFETSYNFALDDITDFVSGNVTVRGLANYVSKFQTVTPGATTYNLAGEDDHPMWRWTTQLSYGKGPWNFFLQARYSGDGFYDKTTLPNDLPQYKVGAQVPIDINMSYDIPTGSGITTLFVNVTDLFNDQPPAFSNTNDYDPIGRYYRAGVRVSL